VSSPSRVPKPRTDLDWAALHLEALFQSDDRGRLIGRRAPGAGPPPRFHFVRTRLGAIWRFAADLPEPVVRDLARYAALEPGCALDPARPPAPPDRIEPMRRVLEAHGPITATWNGPAYRLPEPDGGRVAIGRIADGAHVATEPDDPRLEDWARQLGEPVESIRAALPIAVSIFEGRVVSSCRVARGDAGRFAEAGVETLESARGRGHAVRCVAAWALAVEACGGHPLYSTQWSNRASRRVAEKLGAVICAEDFHFR